MRQSPDDTIAAISTPPGEGGIGIVRLSGDRAIQIVRGLFVSSRNIDIATGRQRVYHGHIVDDRREIVDEALIHIMRAPHSYTCEDVVEINAHGGFGPLNAILDLVLRKGARLAKPGEFTQRAFLNGRLDLVQAEAVIDRIRARTRASLSVAAQAANGTLSKSIHNIKSQLVEALACVEASVDFPDEDLPDLINKTLNERLRNASDQMTELLETAEAGRLYREGAAITICGKPNVGKSCLFNALLRDARAIVSPQPGTTRDRIEETITLSGVPVRLTDTAGLRTTSDEVEQIGVGIARGALAAANVILLVLDSSLPFGHEDEALAHELVAMDRPVWVVLNKKDIAGEVPAPPWTKQFAGITSMSAKTGEGLFELEKALGKLLIGDAATPDHTMITRAHQRDSLRRAVESVRKVLDGFDASPELLSVDLREAVNALGEITGETTPEDILEQIFSTFCVGK